MTVNNNDKLSDNDYRITEASQDIELLLYSNLLRYTKMENELKELLKHVNSVEDGEELQGLNLQTRVLVANTMITVLGTAIGFSGYITGGFGMNLNNNYGGTDLEGGIIFPPGSFTSVFVCTFIMIFVLTKAAMFMLRRSGILPKEDVFSWFTDRSSVKKGLETIADDDA